MCAILSKVVSDRGETTERHTRTCGDIDPWATTNSLYHDRDGHHGHLPTWDGFVSGVFPLMRATTGLRFAQTCERTKMVGESKHALHRSFACVAKMAGRQPLTPNHAARNHQPLRAALRTTPEKKLLIPPASDLAYLELELVSTTRFLDTPNSGSSSTTMAGQQPPENSGPVCVECSMCSAGFGDDVVLERQPHFASTDLVYTIREVPPPRQEDWCPHILGHIFTYPIPRSRLH
ncbi:hypothetical protein BJY52DRAFT_403758 [Lactarius psammicola]|nr:hypothetical protein BJY52DRAFT_403758 [Lactarius psammicola]